MDKKNHPRQKKQCRVSVVCVESGVVRNPAVFSLLNCLAPHFSVDLLTEYPAEANIKGVTNHYAHQTLQHSINIESKSVLRGRLKEYIKRVPPLLNLLLKMRKTMAPAYNRIKGIGPLYRHVNGSPQWGTPEFVSLIAQRCTQKLCDAVISVDVKELIMCHQAVTEVPIIYYSIELHHRGHPEFFPTHLAPLKDAEAAAFKHIRAVIIQDEERARFLWQDNQRPYEPEKVILFPVSYMGQATIKRSDYFRSLYPELAKQKLIVQMGSIKKCRRSYELIEIAASCPEQYDMIFHGFTDELANKALTSNSFPRSRYSQPAPIGDVEKVAAGADIGLVFYFDNNFNDRLIAHASSQFALFMKCGVPVLSGNVGSLSRIVRQYHCGIVVEDLANLFNAADEIMADYETYSQCAVRCFEEEHQLRRFCENLIERLIEMCKYPGY